MQDEVDEDGEPVLDENGEPVKKQKRVVVRPSSSPMRLRGCLRMLLPYTDAGIIWSCARQGKARHV